MHPFTRNVRKPKTKHPLYYRWSNMRKYGESNMCKEWFDNYNTFLLWSIKNGYKQEFSVLRSDKTKGFYPDNCFFG